MASILAAGPETFTGTNGATPNTANTVVGVNDNGGSWQIQGNQGRIRTGATQFNRTSARLALAARADAETVFDWVIPADGVEYTSFYARHSNTNIDTQQGYYFTLERTQMIVGRAASYSGTDITTKSYAGRSVGQIMRTRVAVFGTALKARTWPASDTEDTGSWDISVTDSVITASGYFGWTSSSASNGAKELYLDNIDAYDTETPTQKKINPSGTLTAGGTITKTVRKPFTGTITPAGTANVRRIVVRVFTGTITAAGPFTKVPLKAFAGSIATIGMHAKYARKMLGGSIATSATLMRRVVKRLTGSITAAGTLDASNVGRTFGRPGLAVMKIRKAGAVRARVQRG